MALRRVAGWVVLAGLAAGTLTACGDGDSEAEEAAEKSMSTAAADEATCKADATAIDEPYGEGFPTTWKFPSDTTVYDYQDEGDAGVVVTGITTTPFADVLDYLNNDAVDAGFTITEGETEEHDAEANWTATDYDGRWAIRESAQCTGETVVQVLAYPAK